MADGYTPRAVGAPLQLVPDGTEFPARSSTQMALQRAFDLLLSIVALIVLAIPAAVIAIVVKTTSAGPVVFRQPRVGRNGEIFTVWKFRTMCDGTHHAVLSDDAERQAYRDNDFKLLPDDPRITTTGRWLRKTSLDELPQLVNVLRGQMSVVGVRPLLSDELSLRPLRDQLLYHQHRPGMTGLWQVNGRSSVQKIDRLALDRYYLENWSVRSDVVIAARTPLALVRIHHTH